VTYFFNGQRERPFPKERRILISSNRKVPTYDKAPQMSAIQITNRAVYETLRGKHDVIIINYANPDMVGHTGVFSATVKALKTVDHCLAEVIPTALRQGGIVCLTADHGNCEEKIDRKTKRPLTAHTTNPVPFVLIGRSSRLRKSGILADVAPTMLQLLGIRKPKEMTGKSLIC
jgi:2,3-bisphosphoglycerate-independent phosphoglycerate mutase